MIKIVLSRKGFDSANGGYPSLILPNGLLLSIPIPELGQTITYSDLKINIGKKVVSYYDLLKQLTPRLKYKQEKISLKKNTSCHLDPDIYSELLKRPSGWRGAFGQKGAAQRHLEKEGISEGDVFLFFGWFRNVILNGSKFFYDRNDWDKHVIFGYLQIGKIIKPDLEPHKIPNWLKNHPHVIYSKKNRENNKLDTTNTIYIARKTLSWNKRKNGFGVFRFNNKLILTKKGLSRSKWNLPSEFRNVKISHHNLKSWKKEFFQSTPIGQEFVIETNEKILEWIKFLIES